MYIFLYQAACPQPLVTIGDPSKLFWSPIKGSDITWNFEKFLIDKTGQPRFRFIPNVEPSQIKEQVKEIL